MTNDWQHAAIGLVHSKILVKCPACARMITASRVLGVGKSIDHKWFEFPPHRSPCGRQCITGACKGIAQDVHRGPYECDQCDHGDTDVDENYSILDI
jgi:hypothetical protein